MPIYTVSSDIYNVVSQTDVAELTDDTDGTTPDLAVVEDAMNRAEGIVNSFLKKQYTVPLPVPVSGDIRHYVLTLTKCHLFSRRRGILTDEQQTELDRVYAQLKDIAAGKSAIEASTASESAFGGETDTDPEVFTDQIF